MDGRRQVFGLAGGATLSLDLVTVASQPVWASAHDGFRSRSPLRGSPGFPPGFLFRLSQPICESTDVC